MEDWYRTAIQEVAKAHAEQLRGDLDRLRVERANTQRELDELDRKITSFEFLVELADEGERTNGSGESHRSGSPPLTLHMAMVDVLRKAPGERLRASDIAQSINKERLYWMRDGRPVEPQQIHARVGHYSHLFRREGTLIGLVEQNQ